jgi:ATP-dependent RNA helicase DeaD
LSRLLETEDLQSALIFTRTRAASGDLAAALLERGYVADALNGELSQAAREAVLRRFRNGQLPILVATDVVARGVDISGVSHVFNFDMPYDPEDYVHRIGRTGRAGRSGIAITLVTPREKARLSRIEQFIKGRIPLVELPKLEAVRAKRDQRFGMALAQEAQAITAEDEQLVADLLAQGWTAEQLAAAAVRLARADERQRPVDHVKSVKEAPPRERESAKAPQHRKASRAMNGHQEAGMVRLWINAGESDGLRPRDVVGTIANMAGIPGKAIGAITIEPNRTYVDVKDSHVEQALKGMKRWRLRGRAVQLARLN